MHAGPSTAAYRSVLTWSPLPAARGSAAHKSESSPQRVGETDRAVLAAFPRSAVSPSPPPGPGAPGPQAATVRLHPHAYVLHQSSCFFQAALQNWRGTFLVCVIPLCYRGRSLCFALQSQALLDSILNVLRPKDKKEIYEIIKI